MAIARLHLSLHDETGLIHQRKGTNGAKISGEQIDHGRSFLYTDSSTVVSMVNSDDHSNAAFFTSRTSKAEVTTTVFGLCSVIGEPEKCPVGPELPETRITSSSYDPVLPIAWTTPPMHLTTAVQYHRGTTVTHNDGSTSQAKEITSSWMTGAQD